MKEKGFTLIELMVVVAIVGIMSATVVPLIGHRIEKNAITKVREEVSDYLKTLVERAYEEGRAIDIDIDPGANRITAYRTGDSAARIGRTYEIPARLNIYTLKDINPAEGDRHINIEGKSENNEIVNIRINTRGTIEFVDKAANKYDSLTIVSKTKSGDTPVAIRLSNVVGLEFGKIDVYSGSGGKNLNLRVGK